jgi:hypothetical protein
LAVLFLLAGLPGAARAQTCGAAPTLSPQLLGRASCQLTSLGLVPLPELGCRLYRGYEGGLYPGGAVEPPAGHAFLGQLALASVVPRDAAGRPSASGRIGFASIGMSNTSMEFSQFRTLALGDPQRDARVVVVNGAQPARDAPAWADPGSPVWPELDARLLAAGLRPAQLQVVWIKQAIGRPDRHGAFPAHAAALEEMLADIVLVAKARYPNLRIAYLSSRTRAYTTVSTTLNPEPFAYESGFAVKWLIERQITGDPALRFNPSGPSPAPWLAWGPYLWADGERPRADGFRWPCSHLDPADLTHPSRTGQLAVAGLLEEFVATEPTAAWYETRSASGCGLLGIEPLAALGLARLARRRRSRRARPTDR